jgi:hypothetical protein
VDQRTEARMDNCNDDSRKKRDSKEVVEGSVVSNEEKTKKLRATGSKQPASGTVDSSEVAFSRPGVFEEVSPAMAAQSSRKKPSDKVTASTNGERATAERSTTESLPACQGLDLEVALQKLVRNDGKDGPKEFLSALNHDSWVAFRVGHAGDASTLAACYQKSTTGCNSSLDTRNPKATNGDDKSQAKSEIHQTSLSNATSAEDTSLEVRLAEGLGDEDTPPAIFALLAEVECLGESDVRHLGAAALLSTSWEDACKVLRVEWFYVIADDDPTIPNVSNLLERRMWLRLSALAMMTSCQILIAYGVRHKMTAQPKLAAGGLPLPSLV